MRPPLLAAVTASLLAGPMLAGCRSIDDEYRNAVPTNQQVTIAVPRVGGGTSGSSLGGSGVGVTSQALIGQVAEYYQFTYDFSTGVNTAALSLLGLLHQIVEQPATSQTQSSRTWGPHTPGGLDPLTYRAVVTKLGGTDYSFRIEARPRASMADQDFLPVLDGKMTLGVEDRTGKGNMTIHFDNTRTLRPTACERGSVTFVFDNTAPVATLDVTFSQFGNDNPKGLGCRDEMPHDATYHYDRSGDGAGNFVFAFSSSIHKPEENRPQAEDISIRSRWLGSGAGRADVKISAGEVATDLAAQNLGSSVILSQCWDAGFLSVYETATPVEAHLVATDGDPGKCAFPSQHLP